MSKKPTPGKTNIVVLGAGKVGKSVAELLLARGKGEYAVTLADASEDSLALAKASLTRLGKHVKHATPFTVRKIDAGNHAEVKALLAGHHAAICMLPFDRVPGIAQACRDARAHYFDVTEDIHATAQVEKLAGEKNAPIAYAPQCGLAPGYVAIAAASAARSIGRSSGARRVWKSSIIRVSTTSGSLRVTMTVGFRRSVMGLLAAIARAIAARRGPCPSHARGPPAASRAGRLTLPSVCL
jgi:short subunit dehydrogenase-like uncharacterized protein